MLISSPDWGVLAVAGEASVALVMAALKHITFSKVKIKYWR